MTERPSAATMRPMTTRTQLIPGALLALCAAAALAPAAAPAAQADAIRRGTYAGRTTQPGTTPFAGAISLKLGLVSNPARIVRLTLTTRLACPDGSTRDDRISSVIYGPRLDRAGRFSHVADGLELSGRFRANGTASGTLARTVGDCSVAGVSWTARR
jgi:hypothetical protein